MIFGIVRAFVGLRVTEEEEIGGLDFAEHGMHAYDFGTGAIPVHPTAPATTATATQAAT